MKPDAALRATDPASGDAAPRETRWARWRRTFLRRRRRLRTTREGKVFLVLTCGIGIGAINTGNNLLYMLLGAMLAFIVLSGILAEIALRGVEIWRRVPSRLHAGHETTITIGVRNRKRHLPSFNLAVRETFGRKRTLDPVEFVHLPPARRDEDTYSCVFPRRGRCRFRGWTLETTFPFGLFAKSREVAGPEVAIVFPRIDLPLERPRLTGAAGIEGSSRRGAGEEFYALREYRQGDDRRRIAWKSSARLRRLVMREPARGAVGAVELVVTNVAGPERRDAVFESLIDHAASLAAMLVESGYAVGLSSFDEPLAPATGGEHLLELLTRLALMRQLDASAVRESGATIVSASPVAERIVLETQWGRSFRPAGEAGEVIVVDKTSHEVLAAAGRAGQLPANNQVVPLADGAPAADARGLAAAVVGST